MSVVLSFNFVNNLWFQSISSFDFLKLFKINRTSSLGILKNLQELGNKTSG
jgi:hypothetical protein